MMNIGEFKCACRFNRAEEFGQATLIEPCGYHASMQRKLDAAHELLGRIAGGGMIFPSMCARNWEALSVLEDLKPYRRDAAGQPKETK